MLAAHGYGVLWLDARGTGESTGTGMAWGWDGARDIDAAVTWLTSRPDVDANRIALLGLSMGGEQAITAAATDYRIRAVVAEGVSARVADDLTFLPGDLRGWIQRVEATLMWAVADAMTEAAPPEPLVDAITTFDSRPLLLIVGAQDPIDSAAARVFREDPGATTEFWEIADAGHVRALATHPREWESKVVSVLDEAMSD